MNNIKHLSQKEIQVLSLLPICNSIEEIANIRMVEKSTINNQISTIYYKFGIKRTNNSIGLLGLIQKAVEFKYLSKNEALNIIDEDE
jgi:DNA-binding NarL/FixJ family response regulator